MSVPIGRLPEAVRLTCLDLRDILLPISDRRLVGLWVHGAVVSDDRPLRPGDIDAYGVLWSPVSRDVARLIDPAHEQAAALHGIERDSWYILEEDVALHSGADNTTPVVPEAQVWYGMAWQVAC